MFNISYTYFCKNWLFQNKKKIVEKSSTTYIFANLFNLWFNS